MAVLVAVSLVRGCWWVATYPVPWGDEGAHLAYVAHVADRRAIPVAGRDRAPLGVVELRKASAQDGYTSRALPASTSDPRWGPFAQQYEAVQPPAYYVLAQPLFWLGRLGGDLGAVYALRLFDLCLVVAALPLTYLLARRLAPGAPRAWLLAPLILAGLQITTSQYVLVSNDPALVPLGAACLLVALRAARRPGVRAGALLGALVGATLLTKAAAALVVPAVVLVLVAEGRDRGQHRSRLAATVLVAAAVAVALQLPWLAFNLDHYGALSGSAVNSRLTFEPLVARSLAGAVELLGTLVSTLWATESVTAAHTTLVGTRGYRLAVDGLVVCCLGGGLLAARRRGATDRLAAVAGGLVLGVLVAVVAPLTQAGSGVQVEARDAGSLLPLVAVGSAVGAVRLLGRRGGPLAIALAVAALGVAELPSEVGVVDHWYVTSVRGTTVPVVDRSVGAGRRPVEAFQATVGCRGDLIGIVGPGSPALLVDGRPAPAAGSDHVDGVTWSLYRPATTVSGEARLTLPASPSLTVGPTRPGGPAPPLLRVWCPVAHPAAYRFAQLWRPGHPFPLGLGGLRAWSGLDAAALAGAALLVLRASPPGVPHGRPAATRAARRPTPADPG
ncbi:MAG TPA: glycosyltransferase family 39 protein [Acidimicrobiales bacterium]|nr:glycosyltransferase family 39 protein [Acidimicrobiales bacterium]